MVVGSRGRSTSLGVEVVHLILCCQFVSLHHSILPSHLPIVELDVFDSQASVNENITLSFWANNSNQD